MAYLFDRDGHLDLSSCYRGLGCDMMLASQISREYYFAELQNLVAWDGLEIRGMRSEAKWRHPVCKHGHDGLPMNPILDLEIERVKRLPLIRPVVSGLVPVDIIAQKNRKGGVDRVELVVGGQDEDYLVSLGFFGDHYVLRSAFPAGRKYAKRVRERGELYLQIG